MGASLLFDEDYLYFYDSLLTPDVDAEDVAAAAAYAGLKPGALVLDAGCGHGRLTAGLLGAGYRVIGLDRSAPFLAAAPERYPAVAGRLLRGDFRTVPIRSAVFAAVVCWFTSFGLAGDEDLRSMLREFRRVLRPEGRLVLDLINPTLALERLAGGEPVVTAIDLGADSLTDTSTFDPASDRIRTYRTIVRDGSQRSLT
jgi:ubiquinone/menaquinone biosynthesis C-methylase UbiE